MPARQRVVTLVVEGTYPAHVGGISTWADTLVRSRPELLFEIIRIGPLPSPMTWAYRLPQNVVSLIAVDPPQDLARDGAEAWATQAASNLPQPELVHAAGTGLAGALGLAFKARGTPLVVTEHASYVEELRLGNLLLESGQEVPRAQREAYIQLFADLRDACYRDADLVTSLYEQRRQLQRMYGADKAKTLTIPNGVIVPTLWDIAERQGPTVGFVGRIATIKDPLKFIDVAEAAAQRTPGLTAPMFGPIDCDADYAERFHARVEASDVVSWHGAVPSPEAFRHIDILLLTSENEAQPLAVLEAMARRIPVVATSVGDVPRMLHDPVLGRRAGLTADDVHTLVEHVVGLASRPDAQRRFGLAGRERVQRHYAIEDTTAAYLRAYRSLQTEPKRRSLRCAS